MAAELSHAPMKSYFEGDRTTTYFHRESQDKEAAPERQSDLLDREVEDMETEWAIIRDGCFAVDKRFSENGGIKLMAIDKRSHSRLLANTVRIRELHTDLLSLIAFALKAWKQEPAIMAMAKRQAIPEQLLL